MFFLSDSYQVDDKTQHKSDIPRIMFLTAIGNGTYHLDGTKFNGKFRIWSFVEKVDAQR